MSERRTDVYTLGAAISESLGPRPAPKIFLVSDGCYSDYSVLGIYDTKERAEHAKIVLAADNDIEEYELNALPETPPGLFAWQVRMAKTGEARANRCPPWVMEGDSMKGAGAQGGLGLNLMRMWAEDEKHAIKIANERRIQALALGEWK